MLTDQDRRRIKNDISERLLKLEGLAYAIPDKEGRRIQICLIGDINEYVKLLTQNPPTQELFEG